MKRLIAIMMILVNGLGNPTENKVKLIVTGTVTGFQDKLPLVNVNVYEEGTKNIVKTDSLGKYRIEVRGTAMLVFSKIPYHTQKEYVNKRNVINAQLQQGMKLEDLRSGVDVARILRGKVAGVQIQNASGQNLHYLSPNPGIYGNSKRSAVWPDRRGYSLTENNGRIGQNESYKEIEENTFKSPWKNPYSTFSIDVDAASYSNVRRFINQGQLPPKDAVKLEEMINYFNYDYEGPRGKQPFAVHQEVSAAPWNKEHQLIHIGLQGERIAMDNLPASNIVFLIDVSGSMNNHLKLPLLKSAFKMLTQQLRKKDRVAIVVYAGAAGEVLPSTSGNEKQKIKDALDGLNAGGSTAGGAGIELAYKIAKKNFIEGGNNRIILATDGDFNVGASSDKAMEELIEEKRKEGVFLTVLGFGMGNYQDSKMEVLADKGNGNHAYIDNILEAKKVLVNEFGGTLFTIAKDVKLQVEFNPATVQAYRLIGYENRRLADEDFNNDKKDAGELGSGHSVTALYEVIPVGVESSFKPLDDLKYQKKAEKKLVQNSQDLVTVKLRYKAPDGHKSKLIQEVIGKSGKDIAQVSDNFKWSAAVASFGMLLRDSDYSQEMDYSDVVALAKSSKGKDLEGYRAEFIKLVETAELLIQNK